MAHKINATKFGIMGAIIGGLKFKLDEMTMRAAEEAEARKEQRLMELRQQYQIADEQRADQTWKAHNAIENQQATERDDRVFRRQLAIQHDSQNFQSGEKQADRQHDLVLEDVRTGNNIRQSKVQTEQQIRAHRDATVFDTEYTKRRGTGNDPTRGKGVLGSDGKTYTYGQPLPPGVKPVGGYGVAWAPSESKSTAPGGARRRGGVGTEALPSARPAAGSMPRPMSQAEYAQLPSGTSYVAPDGSIRVKP